MLPILLKTIDNINNYTLAKSIANRACKLFNIRLYATLCCNYFRWHCRMFLYSSVFELLIW